MNDDDANRDAEVVAAWLKANLTGERPGKRMEELAAAMGLDLDSQLDRMPLIQALHTLTYAGILVQIHVVIDADDDDGGYPLWRMATAADSMAAKLRDLTYEGAKAWLVQNLPTEPPGLDLREITVDMGLDPSLLLPHHLWNALRDLTGANVLIQTVVDPDDEENARVCWRRFPAAELAEAEAAAAAVLERAKP